MSNSTISLGPITLYLYGVFFALGALAGFWMARRRAKVYDLPAEEVENIFLVAVFFGIVFARLYHVSDYFSYYRDHPLEVFAVWQGGLGIFGGIFGGILGIGVYSRRRGLDFWRVLDLLAPSLALGQAIGRWGNFFNQEAFGPPTDLPWKIFIAPENRPLFWADSGYFHPLFLYESGLSFFSFLALIWVARRVGAEKKGAVVGWYFLNYGLIRFLIEFLRWDTAQVGGIKVAHVLSGGSILLGLYFLRRSGIIRRK